jgi:DNA-binding MarR family transcriptional regulator
VLVFILMTATRQSRVRSRSPKAKRDVLELKTLQTFRIVFGSARRYDASVRELSGIPGSLLWALSAIAAGDAMSVGKLSASMALHQTTASNLVNALLERGLIDRVRSRQDKRVALLNITAKGRRLLRRAPRPHAGLLRDGLTRLNAHRLAELQDGLAGLVAEMRSASRTLSGESLLGD